MSNFKGKKIAVLGIGVEGESSVKFLRSKGAKVVQLDKNKNKNYLENLNQYDLVVRTPGLKISELAKKVDPAKITSQTRLFFDLCPCPIIGVTGTKGKGTTSSLIYEMLKKQGKDAYLGGNIGKPPLDFLSRLSPQSIVVLELSSFQLQDMTKSPHIAVMLMTTSEHLDYHKDVKEYVDAKRNILRFQRSSDYAVINRDYPASLESDIYSVGRIYYVSREREGYEGCFIGNDALWLLRDGRKERIISNSEIKIPGKHNLENACAACMAANLSGVSKKTMVSILKTFKGLEHRIELVRELGGVRFYDDSFSTTPETAIAAIEAFKEPKILILGGSGKGSDFTELGQVISDPKNNIKAIIGIGVEWQRIKEKIKMEKLLVEGAKNMGQIVKAASKIAEDGDVVLLSPACASFDMFKNYKDRGEQFKKEVLLLT